MAMADQRQDLTNETKAFLRQIDEAEKRVKAWPRWMQEAAVVRTASFPKRLLDGLTHDAFPEN
jgi:hypothetical protein